MDTGVPDHSGDTAAVVRRIADMIEGGGAFVLLVEKETATGKSLNMFASQGTPVGQLAGMMVAMLESMGAAYVLSPPEIPGTPETEDPTKDN